MDIININGVDYYIPSDYSHFVVQEGDTLTLSKSGSVTLYSNLVEYNNNNSGYPRITLSFGNAGRYITRSGQTTNTINLSVYDWSITNRNRLYDPLLNSYLLIIMCVFLLWSVLFRR